MGECIKVVAVVVDTVVLSKKPGLWMRLPTHQWFVIDLMKRLTTFPMKVSTLKVSFSKEPNGTKTISMSLMIKLPILHYLFFISLLKKSRKVLVIWISLISIIVQFININKELICIKLSLFILTAKVLELVLLIGRREVSLFYAQITDLMLNL